MAVRRRHVVLSGLAFLIAGAALAAPRVEPTRRAGPDDRAARAAGERPTASLVAGALEARRAGGSTDDAVAALLDRAAADPARTDEIASALLLLDRNDAALELLGDAGHQATFALLVAGWRHDDALAMPAESFDADGTVLRARTLATLGLRQEAMDALSSLVPSDAVAATPGVARALREASLLGMRDDALSSALGLVAGQSPGAAAQHELLMALWPARQPEAEAAWTWLMRQEPAPSADEALIRVRAILDASAPSDDADQILREGLAHVGALSGCAQARVIGGLVGIAELRGRKDAALDLARTAATMTGTPGAWGLLGELLAERSQWAEAAAAYGRAADLQPAEGAARWLQSRMIRKSGDAALADALAMRAEASATQACARFRLASAMERAGDRAAAVRVREALLEGVAPASAVGVTAFQQLARTVRTEDEAARLLSGLARARAAAARQPLTLQRVLPLVRALQSAELAAWQVSGDVDAALALSAHALEPFLEDLDATADLAAMLRDASRDDEASALLGAVSERIAAGAAAHPASSRLLNAQAWLSARTRQDLDVALDAATRAVGLAPANAGVLDTLAEVRFQLGDRAGALEAGERARALEPERAYFQAQVERFRSGDPSTDPPLTAEE